LKKKSKAIKIILIAGIAAICIAATCLATIAFVIKPYANKKVIPFECNIDNAFEYDLEKLEKVDPKLIKFKEIKKIPVTIKKPIGVAVDLDQDIFVVGEGSLFIVKNANTPIEVRIPRNASSIAVSADAKVYIGFTDHIEVYDTNGNKLSSWSGLGPDAYISSIAVSDKYVLAADSGNRCIVRYDVYGRILGKIVKRDKDTNENGFVVPSLFFDVAVNSDAKVWVANPGKHSIEIFDPEGDYLSSWNREANLDITDFAGCCNPTHIAASNEGIVTCEKGVTRVKLYTREGKLESVVAPPDSFEKGTVISDIAVDKENRILVLDPKAAAVRVFERIRTDSDRI
jgi:hypothetical protein